MTTSLLALLVVPLLGALLPAWLSKTWRIDPAHTAGGVTLAGLVIVLVLAPRVMDGAILDFYVDWIPQIGLALSLRMGGLSLLFALLILGIGLLIVIYAAYYLSADERRGRFYGFLLLFQGAMLGVVLSENLLLLTVFWELTSLASFLLIGFWFHLPQARQGARLALFVTGAGGLALLGAVILIANIAGSYEFSDVIAAQGAIREHEHYLLILGLVLLAAFTKSAQFPFHFWLPHAMAAPTPVSAYLHSATMVKAGVFLLARFFPVLAGTEAWFYCVSLTGLTTLVFGAYTALFQHDLKGLLAYSTISHLGLITMLLGLGTPLGLIAAVLHIINHAVFKASLFMAAGIIDHETGTRDMRVLSGLFKYMPYTATLAMVAAASMAGVPLLNGFLSKEMFFTETLHVRLLGDFYWFMPVLATLAGAFSVAYSLRFVRDTFFGGPPMKLQRPLHHPPRWMRVPVEILVALCIAVGVLPDIIVRPLLDAAATTMLEGNVPAYKLSVWHGFTLPLAMSIAALGVGATIYSIRGRIFSLHAQLLPDVGGRALAEAALDRLERGCTALYNWIDNRSLQRYVAWLVAVSVAAGIGAPLFIPVWSALTPIDYAGAFVLTVLAGSALATTAAHRQRVVALVVIGIVGLFTALTFTRYSAPDLALTQILVELVTLILILLGLYFMPPATPPDPSIVRRVRDISLSVAAGFGCAVLCFNMLIRHPDSPGAFYLAQAKPGGGGSNVVNVILVDFRGFDTLGEITVLAIAAVAILIILDKVRLREYGGEGRSTPVIERHPVLLTVVARGLLPLALLVAAYLLFRGHNYPGGGFIAGLVTAIALIIQYLARGSAYTTPRLRINYLALAGSGVLLAAATGAGSWFFGRPFLTSWHGHWHVPIIGDVELATAMLFDIGVYLGVVGTVLVILTRLGRESAVREGHP